MSLDSGNEPRILATRLSFLSSLSSLSLSRSPFSEIRSDLDLCEISRSTLARLRHPEPWLPFSSTPFLFSSAIRLVAFPFVGFSLFVGASSILCGIQIRRFPFVGISIFVDDSPLLYGIQIRRFPSCQRLPFRRLQFSMRSISFVSSLDFGESSTSSRSTRSIYCCFLHHHLPRDVDPLSLQQLARSDQRSPVSGDIRAAFP